MAKMVDEEKVFPDEDTGKCPVGYHNMPADSEHDMEWCMEGEEHEPTTYNADDVEKETDKGTETEENMLTTIEEKEAIEPEQKRLALFEVTIEKDTKALKPRTVIARISTTSIDRDGEVLLPSGIDLKDFRKNPVVLLNHDQGGLPVGRALSVKRQSDGIIAEVQFAERPAGHPSSVEWIPDTIFNLFQQGILKAFSVGFIPLEMREPTDKDFKKFGDDVRNVISKWSLLEFSIVNVPSNQDSLVMQVAKNHKWLADEWKINSGQMQENNERKRLQLGGHVARLKID
jgi:HK97 family phage prohead protease